MSPTLINPISFFITLMTILGASIHGAQIDGATIIAMSAPAIVAEYSSEAVDLNRVDQHPLSEVSSFAESTHIIGAQPSIQPNKNDKKYVIQKRVLGNATDNDYIWPSV